MADVVTFQGQPMQKAPFDDTHWSLGEVEVYAVHGNPQKGYVGRKGRTYSEVFSTPQSAANDLASKLKGK